MNLATIALDVERRVGEVSPLLFGGFAEHMGRCIYEGVYDPASALADEDGFRRDVLGAMRELDYRILRYPGGNFLSGYHWQDGVGPKAQRPRRRELAWKSIETNQFGTDEFIRLCRKLETAPMLGVNLGTGTIQQAADLVEYCNAPVGSYYADLRARNGSPAPHDVRYWCLGNEMDGPWQIGHLDALNYGQKAREAAKLMRWHDPLLRLIACGSSGTSMPTYPEWDRVVLETCWEHVDYLSLHYYAGNRDDDTASYLASARQFEDQIDTLAATLRYVQARLRSRHPVYLSWDEWNVWYKNMQMDGQWQEAPHLIEEIYNLEDALVVAQWLNVFLRRADVLKIACIAQVVNIIAPLLTDGDRLLKQSTFYPLWLFSRYARGASLDVLTQAPRVETRRWGDVPVLDVAATLDEEHGRGAAFIVNRSQTESVPTQVVWQRGAPAAINAAWQVAGGDPRQVNSFAAPDTITAVPLDCPPLEGNGLTLSLPPLSFTTLTWAQTR